MVSQPKTTETTVSHAETWEVFTLVRGIVRGHTPNDAAHRHVEHLRRFSVEADPSDRPFECVGPPLYERVLIGGSAEDPTYGLRLVVTVRDQLDSLPPMTERGCTHVVIRSLLRRLYGERTPGNRGQLAGRGGSENGMQGCRCCGATVDTPMPQPKTTETKGGAA